MLPTESEVGKLSGERKDPPREDPKSRSESANPGHSSAADAASQPIPLQPATSGSLGVDLASTVEITLFDKSVQLIPTGVFGPLRINGQAVGALLLGRSSAALKGLLIVPGLVDADYTGEIKIMVKTDFPPMLIPKNSKIAQLIPMTQMVTRQTMSFRGQAGFGSTGQLALFSVALDSRPEISVTLIHNNKSCTVRALLDSGADITILALRHWPTEWPLTASAGRVEGVGGSQSVYKSPPIQLTIDDNTVTAIITLMPLPAGVSMLLGRDILAQIGARLTTDQGF